PVPVALDLAQPSLARCGRRSCAGRGVGCNHGPASLGGVGARRRGGGLDRRLRSLLFVVRPCGRRRAGAAFGGGALRCRRRLLGGAAAAPRDRDPARGGRARPPSWLVVLARGRRRRAPAGVRALARAPGRPAAARRRVLHREWRDQRRLLRVRPRRSRALVASRKIGIWPAPPAVEWKSPSDFDRLWPNRHTLGTKSMPANAPPATSPRTTAGDSPPPRPEETRRREIWRCARGLDGWATKVAR